MDLRVLLMPSKSVHGQVGWFLDLIIMIIHG